MFFLAFMGGPSLITDMKMALRRARFFSKDFAVGGPFSPIGKENLSIPIRNGLWFIDLNLPTTEEDFQCEILCLHWMAKKINEWIDNHLMENDEEGKWALAAFVSRAETICDWTKLDEKDFIREEFVDPDSLDPNSLGYSKP